MDTQDKFYNLEIPKDKRWEVRSQLEATYGDVWGTKDGRLIPMVMMRQSHLVNAYNYHYKRAMNCAYSNETLTKGQKGLDGHLLGAYLDQLDRLSTEISRRNFPFDSNRHKPLHRTYDDWYQAIGYVDDLDRDADWENELSVIDFD